MKICTILVLLIFSSQVFCLETLRLIGDFNISTGEKFKDTEIGGLSGITYEPTSNLLYAVSDDKSIINPARFYKFNLNLEDKSFSVTPNDVVFLKSTDGKTFPKHTIDLEAIVLIGDKMYLSSEGALNRDKPTMPSIIEFNKTGNQISVLPLPEKFLPSKDPLEKKFGSRDNAVFEALGVTFDQKTLFAGMKEALIQDDNVSTPFYSSQTRILTFKDLKPTKEILYQLDRVPSIPVAGLTVGETGLVDLAAIDENTIYTVERAHLPLAKKNIVKIFKVSNIDKAVDISKLDSIKGKDIKPVDKELILNLDDIIPSLNSKFPTLENIAGMCFGPTLKNGNKTLILVGNNKFSKNQRTLFLAFEIIP